MSAAARQTGAASVEAVLVTGFFVVCVLVVAAVGRSVWGRLAVDGASYDAAVAASLARDPTAAVKAAQDAVASVLSARRVACQHIDVAVDTADFRPGGSVTVDIDCQVDWSDLSLLGLPPDHMLHGHFMETIDRYRGSA